MLMENESDERLVERFQTGEFAAFDEIVRRYRPRLLRFLRLRTRSFEVAEDLTQEVLMKAFASLGELKRGAFLSGWLRQTAFRTFIDLTRRRQLATVAFDENGSGDADSSSTTVFATKAPPRRPNGSAFDAWSAESTVDQADESENFWRVARNLLTAKEFKTLWMRYVDGATDPEIAVALGVSHGAVRIALTRARQKLIARLRAEGTGTEEKGNQVDGESARGGETENDDENGVAKD